MSSHADFMEVACAPNSGLSSKMQELGFNIERVNYKEGYDLDRKSGTLKLQQRIADSPPSEVWVSLPCTRLSNLNYLTPRTVEEEAMFQKRQSRDLKRAEEVAESLDPVLEHGGDVSWEWPTGATKGWKSKAIVKLQRMAERHNRKLYWCRFHGCAYGLTWRNYPVQKGWTVATTNRQIGWLYKEVSWPC